MPMIKQASRAIEHMTARERRIQRAKYARRNKMRYIDKLLNELEMLNLADQRQMPPVLSVAINKVIEESPEVTVLAQAKPASVMEAMDALYEIQDSLMYNQIEDEYSPAVADKNRAGLNPSPALLFLDPEGDWSPELLGADPEPVDHGGERVPLLQALFSESQGQVAAERGNVRRTAGQQDSIDIAGGDPSVGQSLIDGCGDEIELWPDHGLEGRPPHLNTKAQRLEVQAGCISVRQGDLGGFDRAVELVRVALVEQRLDDIGCAAANPSQDRRYPGIRHEQAHGACRAHLVEEPARERVQT